MNISLGINREHCIKCAKCVTVCPAGIFKQDEKSREPGTYHIENCIVCGHCVAVCPENAVIHSGFPAGKVHPVDYSLLPTPEQVMLLCKSRRSNRAFSSKPVPPETMEMILEAAHRAPTGSNAQHVKFMVITHPEKLKQVSAFTIDVFGGVMKKLKNPLLQPFIKFAIPDAFKYLPAFEKLLANYEKGIDGILRKATAVIFIYTPKGARMGAMDANLAYQNGSLMAESLGVSQFYTGFVLNAANMKKGKLEKLLGIDGEINAGMALGMPQFRYPSYIDRKDIEVIKM
jgi:nitroreductase/NAD-dependent dihydropyrimidine dehydrogenase PreA subunit